MASTAIPLRAVDEVRTLSPTEVVVTKRIVADDPYLSGHYPGQPIYPGVFVVETARQALELLIAGASSAPRSRTELPSVALTGIPRLRLLGPLVPGDTLVAHVTMTRDGVATVHCRKERDDTDSVDDEAPLVATGTLSFASPTVSVRPTAVPSTKLPTAWPAHSIQGTNPVGEVDHVALRELLPHRHPMLLLDRLTANQVSGGSTGWLIAEKAVSGGEPCYGWPKDPAGSADTPGAHPSQLGYPACLLVESFVQAAAALWALACRSDGTTQDGTLVLGRLTDVVVHGTAQPGQVLRHRANLQWARSGIAVLSGGTVLADRGSSLLSVGSLSLARLAAPPEGLSAAPGSR